MTTLEHVSVKHALDRLPSWSGDGDIAETWDEVEEVNIGVAVTTSDDDDEGEGVGIALGGEEQDLPHFQHEHDSANGNDYVVGEHEGGRYGAGTSRSGSVVSRRSSVCASPLGSGSRSQSGLGSHSHSHSRSRSSVRVALEMESTAATSWTHADAEGLRRSGDEDSEPRPSDEAHCRSSMGRAGPEEEEVIDVETASLREGTEAESSARWHMGRGVDAMSRMEEVIVTQEDDIGEGWHPLRFTGKARSQEGGSENENGDMEEDLGFVHALGSVSGGDQTLEMTEKERWGSFGSSRRNPRHLRLEFKPPSPQPWDAMEPPVDNGDVYASDYYSTLNSKKFGTLQKSRQRPLIPRSTFYFGPPPPDSAYGTPAVGHLGVHHPREIVRVERDYVGGELIQFSPVFPLELEGRITPTQFHQTINDINEILISAHCIRHAFMDNFLAVVTLQLSTLVMASHYTKEMRRLREKIEEQNTQLYNPVGLHILWPQKVAFLFLEIEYY